MPKLPNANHSIYTAACNKWLLKRFEGVDREEGLRRARAATMMILGLPGSTYVYQGEELGLPEIAEINPADRQDPTFRRTRGTEVGRDGCRVPIPWVGEAKNFGFGSGSRAHLPQPEWMGQYAVDVLDRDPESTLNMYRRAIHLRKELQCSETLEWVDSPEGTLYFKRPNGWGIFANVSTQDVPLPKGEVLLASSTGKIDSVVPGETTVWLKT